MTLQEFYDMIKTGVGDKTCPFVDKDDHLELKNSTEFFNTNGALKNETKELINKDTVVFFDEISEGYDSYEIVSFNTCMDSVIEYQNSLEGGG